MGRKWEAATSEKGEIERKVMEWKEVMGEEEGDGKGRGWEVSREEGKGGREGERDKYREG